MKNLKLNQLSKNKLEKKQMNQSKGGFPHLTKCLCACYDPDIDFYSSANNSMANSAEMLP
ncbi:MAG: TIGR04149 family rSAM-modified RiPP [Marinifilaceae bacterium]